MALLFPGQGSQRVGMGADLCERSSAACAVFETVERAAGLPLRRSCFEGPEEALRSTDVAQPALLAVAIAALAALGERLHVLADDPEALLERMGVGWVAGHSLGEYAAAVAVGALTLEDGARLAAERGRLMAAAPPGAMAAVLGLNVERLEPICRATAGTVVVANDNAPGQIVISGDAEAVAAASVAAREAGAARVIPLNVGGAFHSPLMEGAARTFDRALAEAAVRRPRRPLIGNVTARPLDSAEALREDLRQQIARPVRWRETMLTLAEAGAQRAIECGPGNVLAGLARRTTPTLAVQTFSTAADLDKMAAALEAQGG